jgi:hypothetical protein
MFEYPKYVPLNIGDIVRIYHVEVKYETSKVGRKTVKNISDRIGTIVGEGVVIEGPISMCNSDGEDWWTEWRVRSFDSKYHVVSNKNEFCCYELLSR